MKFTKETKYRALRTFIQVFLSTIAGGIASLNVETDSKTLRVAICVLVASAIGTSLAAVMNMEVKENDENE